MKKTLSTCLVGIALSVLVSANCHAQDKLYGNTFSLSDVELLDGPFKHAYDLNIEVLLEYNVDRLLAPFLKEAGLEKKAEYFPNWEGLDGHVGGHYLSALAMHYGATGNQACKERMDYMLSELKRCQDKNGNGYVGGVPDGDRIWSEIQKGNPGIVWNYWVPWYNIHKTYAGLRDAYVYGGSELAKEMFLDLCDWGIGVISPLTDQQMEDMLAQEFGGMNEVYADAYYLSGDLKYLEAAKRFTHHWLFDSMLVGVDNLDNKHANTQVPKVVGHQRTAEMCAMEGLEEESMNYLKASEYFWHTVVNTRSLAFGGNSRREHFAPAEDCVSYVDDREGPETCNTNNMMKLTEGLFRMTSDAKYADFYERAMMNHILSSQHPEHGGYVYFTSARPAHYRVYSSPNNGMWCCVGTGMENHAKYGEFIYTRSQKGVMVNLFVASKLNWAEKGMTLTQETRFPDEETVTFTIDAKKPVKAQIAIRNPKWCDNIKVTCNGVDYSGSSDIKGYVTIDRKWKKGDVIEVSLPMKFTVEELPNEPDYIAIMRGPILLGARMGTEGLVGLVADDHRWAHIAHGPLVSLFDTPIMVGSRDEIMKKIQNMKPVEGKPLHYTLPGMFTGEFENIELEPFFRIHDSRYMMYWLTMDEKDYSELKNEMQAAEAQKLELDRRTVDAVIPGEQQPEADHLMKQENSQRGHFQNEAWREARDGGYFEYTMTVGEASKLMVRYWGDEAGNRTFDILVDGKVLAEENLVGKWNRQRMVNHEYDIPADMLSGKETVVVSFRSKPGTTAGKVFNVRLLK